MRILIRLFIVAFLAAATSLQAITYIVPTDRDLVKRAEAIVVATTVESHSEMRDGGRIVTVATLTLDEVLKGELAEHSSIDLTEMGGFVGDRGAIIPGSPRYAPGQRYLVFLRRTADGWATYGFGLGKFEFHDDGNGRQTLARGRVIEGIFGWDESTNSQHVERTRDAEGFLRFVAVTVANPGAPAREQYFIGVEPEVHTSSFSPSPEVSAPGGLNGSTAMAAAMSNWSGAGAGVNYTVGSSNPSATGGLSVSDRINAILFNDPCGIVPAGVAALGGFSTISGTYKIPPDNVTIYETPTEADVVVGKNFSTNQSTFNGLMTHEVGHTLGFRHSDKTADDSGPCVLPSPCTSNAIMNSSIAFNLQTLQQWDLDAVRIVYGNQTGSRPDYLFPGNPRWPTPAVSFDFCYGATITTQPSGTTIVSGSQTTLTVAATGTNPTYQWYIDNSPGAATPVPTGTSSSLTVSPSTTTKYFVQVRACPSSCIQPVNSNVVTVTVTGCTPPTAPAPSAVPSSIVSGQSSTLTANPTGSGPFTYQWFVGISGNTTSPINGQTNSSVTVNPATTTSYWVRVTGQCAPPADSPATTVTVGPCVPPSAPAPNASPSTMSSGQSSTLSVSPTGTSPFTYQWFVGSSGDQSSPINGATNSFTTVSPTATTSYWVKVTGQCAPASNSPATSVTVTVACTPISFGGVGAQPPTINVGQSSTISVTTNGSGPFTFQWYRGSLGDSSNPIFGATGSSAVVSPVTSTTYWVHVTAPCGSQDGSVTVFVNAPCTASSITTNPSSPTIAPGGSATLTVVAAGTAPISYQWYTGTSGNTSNPIANATNASVTVSPSATTTYWVRVSNSCNQTGNNSTTAVVTVSVSCPAPAITTQPAPVSAPIGTLATLNVAGTVTGTTIHYQWYKGAKGDLSTKVGTDSPTFTTGAVATTASYWVRLTPACSTNNSTFTDSNAAIVTAIAPVRGRAVRH